MVQVKMHFLHNLRQWLRNRDPGSVAQITAYPTEFLWLCQYNCHVVILKFANLISFYLIKIVFVQYICRYIESMAARSREATCEYLDITLWSSIIPNHVKKGIPCV